MSFNIQRLNEINHTISELYGQICCEMSKNMSLSEANILCNLQENMTDALGNIRGLIIIELQRNSLKSRIQESDLKGLAKREAQQ